MPRPHRRPPCRRASEGASVDRFEGRGRRVALLELLGRFGGFLAGVRRGVAKFVPAVVVCQRARRQRDAGAARLPPLYRRGIRWRESTCGPCATLYLLCLHKRSIIAKPERFERWTFRRRASGVPARPVFRRRRGTAVLVALSIVCFAPFSRYYHAALSIERTARLTPGFRQSTRSYGRFSLLAMSVIDQETHIKTSSAAAASPRRRPASFRVSRYVVSKKE